VESVLLVDVADQFDGFHGAPLWRFERSDHSKRPAWNGGIGSRATPRD